MADDLVTIRRDILEAALTHVAFDGWTENLLIQAVADLGLDPSYGRRAFSGGVTDLLAFFMAEADRCMLADLEAADLAELGVRARVALAIRLRFDAHIGHREAIRRALVVLSMPHHAPLAAKSLYRTVDAVWHGIGDRSVDFNFYSKRALLAGVYSTTLMRWLNDQSEGQQATWNFLDRRLADVMRIEKAKKRLGDIADRLPDPTGILRRIRRI